MDSPSRPSGIAAVGDIPWHSHFCQFYRGKADLAETLVPLFEAGLRNNESCLWVTSHELDVRWRALAAWASERAKRIVEMHDGRIAAHSDGPDRGTAFVVRLALAAHDGPEWLGTIARNRWARVQNRRVYPITTLFWECET